jgi:formylglycine-generating enzyme required for sulfatase activity
MRGGSWRDSANSLRSASRSQNNPLISLNSVGFRVVRPIDNGK